MSPLRTHVSFSRRGGPVAVATLVAALVCAAVLAACGGSSGGASPSADAADSSVAPAPSPQVTSGPPPAAAVAVVEEFWTLLGEGRLREAQRSLVAPGSPILQWGDPGIASARFVDVAPGSVDPRPEPGDEEQRRRNLDQLRSLAAMIGGPASAPGCEFRRRENLRLARGE